MTGSAIDGEDLVQEVAVRAIDAFARTGPITEVEAWLFRIAHNTALNLVARRKRERAVFLDKDPQMIAEPESEVENREAATAGLQTFMYLPAAQRSGIILKDVLGYSLEDICAITGTTIAAIKANLHRGRARLRQLLQKTDDTPMPALHEPERSRLKLYVERFNARDFDSIRDMLAEEVRLDLVNHAQRKGRGGFDSYLGNYRRTDNWRLAIGFVDRRPAILVLDPSAPSGPPRSFALIDWQDETVLHIRDFTHAPYVMTEAEVIVVD
jgi:RNA polymerase sigma-70 factor, ECF subfamily